MPGTKLNLTSSLIGEVVHIQVPLDVSQMLGEYTFSIEGYPSVNAQTDIIGQIRVFVCDFSQPRLVEVAPSCGPSRGGTLVLLGITGARTLRDNACVQLDGQKYDDSLTVGVVPVSEWGNEESESFADIMRRSAHLSQASEALAAEYSGVVSKTIENSQTQNIEDSAVFLVLKMPKGLQQKKCRSQHFTLW